MKPSLTALTYTALSLMTTAGGQAATLNIPYQSGYIDNSFAGPSACRRSDYGGLRHQEADTGGSCFVEVPLPFATGTKISQISVLYGSDGDADAETIVDVTVYRRSLEPATDVEVGVQESDSFATWTGTVATAYMPSAGMASQELFSSDPGNTPGFTPFTFAEQNAYLAMIELHGKAEFFGLKIAYEPAQSDSGAIAVGQRGSQVHPAQKR